MSFILRFAILFASSTLAFSPSWSPAEHVAVDEEPPPAPWIGSLGRMKFAPPAMGSSRDMYTGPCAFISLIVNVPFDASTDSTTATCPAAGSAPCTPGGKLTIAPGTGAVRVTL